VAGANDIERGRARPSAWGVLLALALAGLLSWLAGGTASGRPLPTRLVHATGTIVPIPASIPHEEGDMIDRRIVGDLRWIARHFPIFVTDGYSGPLPDGEHVGCHGCHVRHSDHYNGLAVDIVPLHWSAKCNRSWRGITRLAHWAEPVQNRPRPPFRWVGYNGDRGHGCGNHLHLSWEHSFAPQFQLAEWVEVFPVRGEDIVQSPGSGTGLIPGGQQGGAQLEGESEEQTSQERPDGPRGGISQAQMGGISPHGD